MSNTKTKKDDTKLVSRPILRPKESNHYSSVWFTKDLVELKESKIGNQYYIVTIDDNEIMLGTKAFINDSKDGKKKGFHIQNSREYRIFGTSEMITGKQLIEYSIQLATFNKQSKTNK